MAQAVRHNEPRIPRQSSKWFPWLGTPKEVIDWREEFGNFVANQVETASIPADFKLVLKAHEGKWNEYFHKIHNPRELGRYVFTVDEMEEAKMLRLKSAALMLAYERMTKDTPRTVARKGTKLKGYHMYAPVITGVVGFGLGYSIVKWFR